MSREVVDGGIGSRAAFAIFSYPDKIDASSAAEIQ
jgi:hypothetical protein